MPWLPCHQVEDLLQRPVDWIGTPVVGGNLLRGKILGGDVAVFISLEVCFLKAIIPGGKPEKIESRIWGETPEKYHGSPKIINHPQKENPENHGIKASKSYTPTLWEDVCPIGNGEFSLLCHMWVYQRVIFPSFSRVSILVMGFPKSDVSVLFSSARVGSFRHHGVHVLTLFGIYFFLIYIPDN